MIIILRFYDAVRVIIDRQFTSRIGIGFLGRISIGIVLKIGMEPNSALLVALINIRDQILIVMRIVLLCNKAFIRSIRSFLGHIPTSIERPFYFPNDSAVRVVQNL